MVNTSLDPSIRPGSMSFDFSLITGKPVAGTFRVVGATFKHIQKTPARSRTTNPRWAAGYPSNSPVMAINSRLFD